MFYEIRADFFDVPKVAMKDDKRPKMSRLREEEEGETKGEENIRRSPESSLAKHASCFCILKARLAENTHSKASVFIGGADVELRGYQGIPKYVKTCGAVSD